MQLHSLLECLHCSFVHFLSAFTAAIASTSTPGAIYINLDPPPSSIFPTTSSLFHLSYNLLHSIPLTLARFSAFFSIYISLAYTFLTLARFRALLLDADKCRGGSILYLFDTYQLLTAFLRADKCRVAPTTSSSNPVRKALAQ